MKNEIKPPISPNKSKKVYDSRKLIVDVEDADNIIAAYVDFKLSSLGIYIYFFSS